MLVIVLKKKQRKTSKESFRMSKSSSLYFLALVLVAALSCSPKNEFQRSADYQPHTADLIFLGENIITMESDNAEAVAIIGDRIAAVGDKDGIMGMKGDRTRVVELGAHALLPGFIDAHGHFGAVATYSALLDLSSPPVGEMENMEDVVDAIRQWISVNDLPEGTLVYGVGYDDSLLSEKRHPNRDDLDLASTSHPIVIRHVSGHLASANSLALYNNNIDSLTQNPPGGVIRRRAGSQEPDGVMEETAMSLLPGRDTLIEEEMGWELRRKAVEIYASYGITTIQESNVSASYVRELKQQGLKEPFAADIVTYVMGNPLSETQLSAVDVDSEYVGGVRNGGVKFILDGSPQGRTAWMSKPYHQGPPGAKPSYSGYPSYLPDSYKRNAASMLRNGIPILVHANGDAAIELMVDGIDEAISDEAIVDHRSVIIHAQLIREDQLDRVKKLGIVPSYYAAHPYFWGDWHRQSFGDARASFISPLKATINREIPFTIHNDSPIVPPDIMRLVSISVNRLTRSGRVLGPDQRVSVQEALYSVTKGAAYQYFEENDKGSIAVGKRADFVVLEKNPMKVDPLVLADVAVIETFSRGKSIYKK